MRYKESKKRVQWIAVVIAFLFGFMGLHHFYLGRNPALGALKLLVSLNWLFLKYGSCDQNLITFWSIAMLVYWVSGIHQILKLSRHRFNYFYN